MGKDLRQAKPVSLTKPELLMSPTSPTMSTDCGRRRIRP